MFLSLNSQLLRLMMAAALFFTISAPLAQAQTTAFRQAVAEAASRDEELATFYREREFQGIWSDQRDAGRRNALMAAFADAAQHGLPAPAFCCECEIMHMCMHMCMCMCMCVGMHMCMLCACAWACMCACCVHVRHDCGYFEKGQSFFLARAVALCGQDPGR